MTEKITSAEEMEKEFTSEESSNQQDSMKAYMNAISGFPLVSIEEEKQLSRSIQGRNKKKSESASNTLIQANLRLVVKIAHDYKGNGLPLVDLISEGNIGLMKAVRKFDPSKGAKFSSYAAWWIKQCMRRAISNQTQTIRIPVQTGSKMSKIKRMRGILKIELEREPTDFELACAVNLSERTVNTLRNSWAASSICELYRSRWGIEVFFKEIKQTLQLADFMGTSENAVRWQIWIALLVYLILRFIAWKNAWKHSFNRLFTLVRGIIWNFFELESVMSLCNVKQQIFTRPPPANLQQMEFMF